MSNMQSHEEQALSPTPSHTEEAMAMVPEKATKNTRDESDCASSFSFWRGWDMLGLILALAVLIAIIVILSVYENKEQPSWKYMSLNTLLSWLSTVCKACILFPASATLSQLKWVWFAERKRPLSDLRVFDGASRGIYGSAELLWTLRMRHFSVLGALAIILSIGVEPFVQNLVHYSASLVEDTSYPSPYLANSTYYDSVGPMKTYTPNPYYIDHTLKANIYNSIFNSDPGQPWAVPHYTCGTGNCTWGPVPSIAMRALCSDVSSSINETCHDLNKSGSMFNCTLGLPDGVEGYIAATGTLMKSIVLTVGIPKKPIVYTNAAFPVIQRLESAAKNTGTNGQQYLLDMSNHTFIATECTLHPIVRSVNASVKDSRYEEHTLAEWDSVTAFSNDTSNPDVIFGYSLVPDWNEDLGNHPGQNFTISADSRWCIDYFISTVFSGYASSSSEEFYYTRTSNEEIYATEDTLETLLYGDISGCANIRTGRFQCAMDNIAKAMSKSFRDQAYVRDKNTTNMAIGTTKANAIIVHIRWQWLTLPLLFWLLTSVAWTGAVWKTRRASVPKWYESPLPLLFLYRGDSEEKAQEMEGGLSVEAYAQRAKEIEAQLHAKDNQAAFIVSSQPSPPTH